MLRHQYLFWLILCSISVSGQTKHTVYYPDGIIHIEYYTKNGLLNGNYNSFHENGQKKAEGQFIDNQRKGNWTIYDEQGTKRMERTFKNSFDSKIIEVWDSTGEKCKTIRYSNPKYTIADPAFGYIPYFPLTEKEVAWSKTLYRDISVDSMVNKPLFHENHLYKIILEGIKSNEINAYGDQEFRNTLTYDSIKEYENSAVSVFRIKEDLLYNKTLNFAEYRIISICPAIRKSGRTKPLFWIYYPEIRGILAKKSIRPGISADISNFENIFQYRYFFSIIYKENNVYDREIRDYKKGKDIVKEAERIEMSVMDYECEWWYKNIVHCKK
ncbi:MAG TPA: hypothetical protein PKW80_04850 [Bacteroidales bacterium]|nr:hypothetical protein [Bacteroidales bacterium]